MFLHPLVTTNPCKPSLMCLDPLQLLLQDTRLREEWARSDEKPGQLHREFKAIWTAQNEVCRKKQANQFCSTVMLEPNMPNGCGADAMDCLMKLYEKLHPRPNEFEVLETQICKHGSMIGVTRKQVPFLTLKILEGQKVETLQDLLDLLQRENPISASDQQVNVFDKGSCDSCLDTRLRPVKDSYAIQFAPSTTFFAQVSDFSQTTQKSIPVPALSEVSDRQTDTPARYNTAHWYTLLTIARAYTATHHHSQTLPRTVTRCHKHPGRVHTHSRTNTSLHCSCSKRAKRLASSSSSSGCGCATVFTHMSRHVRNVYPLVCRIRPKNSVTLEIQPYGNVRRKGTVKRRAAKPRRATNCEVSLPTKHRATTGHFLRWRMDIGRK